MKTHCITLKQSQVGAKTIRFDVSRKKCEMEMITRVSTSKIIIHDLIILYSCCNFKNWANDNI